MQDIIEMIKDNEQIKGFNGEKDQKTKQRLLKTKIP